MKVELLDGQISIMKKDFQSVIIVKKQGFIRDIEKIQYLNFYITLKKEQN